MSNANTPIIKVAQDLALWLNVDRFHDYAPNGLQVAPFPSNRPLVKLAGAVTASLNAIQQATAWGADALLVHHGYFWKNEARELVGIAHARIQAFMASGMGLMAYHLPLDAHEEWGNNAQLAKLWGLVGEGHFGEEALGCVGSSINKEIKTVADWVKHIEESLQRKPLLIGKPDQMVCKVGWCSGGAQSYFEDAIRADVDLFITGEASEYCYHLANESGVAFIAAGHHATERFGVMALGVEVAKKYACEFHFFDEPNPI